MHNHHVQEVTNVIIEDNIRLFMEKLKKVSDKIIYSGFILGILLYLGTIIWINLNGQQWLCYDMYYDAVFAEYMSKSGSFFPENWVFGNQYYIVATPVVAALINFFLNNACLSLGVASCIMTLLVIGCYIWCIKPFISNRSLIIGLFCLIGGVSLGNNATTDINGLQVFFTMASYYSCYVIGILFTLGIWLRLYTKKSVNLFYIVIAILLNVSLGMQSLREMLVLNIPLCLLIVYVFLIERKKITKLSLLSKENSFAIIMLISNLLGIFLISLFIGIFEIKSYSILADSSSNLFENIQHSFSEFLSYTALTIPYISTAYISVIEILRFTFAIFILLVVVYTVFSILKSKCKSPISLLIIFCLLSLFAIFLAGIFIIKLRAIYFFVWYLLVTFSFVYVSEKVFKKVTNHYKFHIIIIFVLLFMGFANYYRIFKFDFTNYNIKQEFYKGITTRLQNDNIKYIYADWRVPETGAIPALSDGEIICGTTYFNDSSDNLIEHFNYLYSKDWYNPENFKNSYIVFSDESLDYLNSETSDEYRDELFSNLTLEYKTEYNLGGKTTTYHFYKGTDKIYNGLMKD